MSKSALIVVTYNNWNVLTRCLQSVYENTSKDYHLFIIDNNSTDNTQGLYAMSLPNTTIVRNNENKWWVGGINQGIQMALYPGEFDNIFFMNDDIILPPNWIDSFIQVLSDPMVGACGSFNSSSRDWQGYDNVRKRFKDLNLPLLDNINRSDLIGMNSAIKSFRLKPIEVVGMFAFFCTGFRKDVIQKVGYLDSRFASLMCGDDDDYCKRISTYYSDSLRYKLMFILDTYIIHTGGSSISKLSDFTKRQSEAVSLLRSKYPI